MKNVEQVAEKIMALEKALAQGEIQASECETQMFDLTKDFTLLDLMEIDEYILKNIKNI